jgi:hypothetical protein
LFLAREFLFLTNEAGANRNHEDDKSNGFAVQDIPLATAFATQLDGTTRHRSVPNPSGVR